MTSGGNNFNDFPENQLTTFQLGPKNVTVLHTFAVLFQYRLSTAEKRNIWCQAGTRDNEAKIRDVAGNTGRLATLRSVGRLSLLTFTTKSGAKMIRMLNSLLIQVQGFAFMADM